MSRRLQERHSRLREAEVFLEDVPRHGSFRVALVWPNLYFVGMSNLGFQAVYRLLNRTPDVVCERAFLPDDEDKLELERTGSPLVSFETGTPLRDFDAIAFSISFENDYLHVLQVLRLAGHPAAREGPRPARPARDPGRRGDVPEPGAARALRRPRRGGRGRADRAADDGGAPGRRRSAQGPGVAPAEGRLLHPEALRGPLPRRTAPSPPTTARGASRASAAGRAPWASRSR